MALPVTFLILFVSTLGIVAFTYYYSVERVGAQGTNLKVSTAKQNLLSLDSAIVSTLWQPGSSATYELSDSGGKTIIEPENNTLTLQISNSEISQTIFNAAIGKVTYQLPYSSSSQTGLFLKGDSKSITNQSGSSMSQLCIANGLEYAEIQLRYRPSITYAVTGVDAGRAVNSVRIYIVNLNQSDSMSLYGKLPLQMTCKTTELSTRTYQVSSDVGSLTVTSELDGSVTSLSIPISTDAQGAEIHLETVVCNISIERWIR
ncbi:MAG: hypothetical protein M1540_08605 [Candidatus Bathyarchaeota archaeon]|nr:hypothetical protein [Candidatus Bathyarchaeota archaeon]